MSRPPSVGEWFGPILDGDRVCRAMRDTLKTPPEGSTFPLLVYYLAEVERQAGLDARKLPAPKEFVTLREVQDFPEGKLPSVVVASTGLTGTPTRLGEGQYAAEWGVSAGVIVKGTGRDDTRIRLTQYVAAIRACVLQNGLTGVDAAVSWVDEGYDLGDPRTQRTHAAGEVGFTVEVLLTVTDAGTTGPPAGVGDPYADPEDWVLAETVDFATATGTIERET